MTVSHSSVHVGPRYSVASGCQALFDILIMLLTKTSSVLFRRCLVGDLRANLQSPEILTTSFCWRAQTGAGSTLGDLCTPEAGPE